MKVVTRSLIISQLVFLLGKKFYVRFDLIKKFLSSYLEDIDHQGNGSSASGLRKSIQNEFPAVK